MRRIADWADRVEMPEPTGLTDKNTRRLRALMQPRVRAMLLWFPKELLRRAAAIIRRRTAPGSRCMPPHSRSC